MSSIANQDVVRAELHSELADLLVQFEAVVYSHRYLPLEYPIEGMIFYIGGTPGSNFALGSGDPAAAYYRYGMSIAISLEKFSHLEAEQKLDEIEAAIFAWIGLIQGMQYWTKVRFATESFRPPIQSMAAKVRFLNMQLLVFPRRIV